MGAWEDYRALRQAELKRPKATPMECLECGAKFAARITAATVEVKCRKCGGYDTDIVGIS